MEVPPPSWCLPDEAAWEEARGLVDSTISLFLELSEPVSEAERLRRSPLAALLLGSGPAKIRTSGPLPGIPWWAPPTSTTWLGFSYAGRGAWTREWIDGSATTTLVVVPKATDGSSLFAASLEGSSFLGGVEVTSAYPLDEMPYFPKTANELTVTWKSAGPLTWFLGPEGSVPSSFDVLLTIDDLEWFAGSGGEEPDPDRFGPLSPLLGLRAEITVVRFDSTLESEVSVEVVGEGAHVEGSSSTLSLEGSGAPAGWFFLAPGFGPYGEFQLAMTGPGVDLGARVSFAGSPWNDDSAAPPDVFWECGRASP